MPRTRKRRGGLSSKCITICNSTCDSSCQNLCNVSKNDVLFHKQNFEELRAKKDKLVLKLEEGNKDKVKLLIEKTGLTPEEQSNLADIIKSKDVTDKAKRLVLKIQQESKQPTLFQVPKQGGFSILSNYKKDDECESDCRKRCKESCLYLCGESIDKLSSMYKKEIKVLEEEISVLEEVNKLMRVV